MSTGNPALNGRYGKPRLNFRFYDGSITHKIADGESCSPGAGVGWGFEKFGQPVSARHLPAEASAGLAAGAREPA